MTDKEKIVMIEETLEVEEGSLSADTILSGLDEYDSMAKLSLIVLMDDEFGVRLTGEMVKGFKSVGDILAVMNK